MRLPLLHRVLSTSETCAEVNTEDVHDVGRALEGTHHRGIDDAQNIARLLRWIFPRGPG